VRSAGAGEPGCTTGGPQLAVYQHRCGLMVMSLLPAQR
jgi:hypothetical protein